MARNQKLSYKMNMNMFHFLTKQNYSKYSQISMSMSFSKGLSLFLSSRTDNCDFSFFGGGVYSKGGRLFEGAFILKSEILGGRSFEGGVYSRRGVYSRKYGIFKNC